MQKRGQFYLISAIIVAVSLASIFVVSNYVRRDPVVDVTDIDEEMTTESRYLLEYGLNQKLSDDNFHTKMGEFVTAYTSYTQNDRNFYFIFATENKLTIAGYQKEANELTLNEQEITTVAGTFSEEVTPTPTDVDLVIDKTQLRFTINTEDTGRDFYSVVTDTTGLVTGEDITVNTGFIESNTAPVMDAISDHSVNEGGAYIQQASATDAENDDLTYSLTVNPGWLLIDSVTGDITGTAPDVGVDTDQPVEVTVSDGEYTDAEAYTLTINFVPNDPVITSTPITSVDEDTDYFYQVTATDADGDTLSYSMVAGSPAWISVDSVTGTVEGTPPDVTQDTEVQVGIEVSDGQGTDSQIYTLTIVWIEDCTGHSQIVQNPCTSTTDGYKWANICDGGATPTLAEKNAWCATEYGGSWIWGCNNPDEIGCSWCNGWLCPGASQTAADNWCSANIQSGSKADWGVPGLVCNGANEIKCAWQTCV